MDRGIVQIQLNDGTTWPHQIIKMPGNGACLFNSLSYVIFQNLTFTDTVRSTLVNHVVNYWEDLGIFSCDDLGRPYITKEAYAEDMLKSTTYGSACELMAAGQIYPYTFEVYRDSQLMGSFGSCVKAAVKRLSFSGNDLCGHYDVLLPLSKNEQLQLSNLEKSAEATKQRGRPIKTKRGRPKSSDNSRCEQLRDAAARYRKKFAKKRKESVDRYSKAHPMVHQEAVRRYSKAHPGVNQKAVARYSKANPKVNQEAVARYSKANPKVNQEAVSRYSKANPKVNQEAVSRYSKANPKVNQEAVARYSAAHPEVNKEAVQRKRSYEELNFKNNNVEKLKEDLAAIIGDRIEAEKIIKWTLYNRQATLVNLNRTVKSLKQKCVVALEKITTIPVNSSATEKLEALLGKSEHRDNQEPYFVEQSYKLYSCKDIPIAINESGKAMFTDIEKKSKSFAWSCHDSTCALDESTVQNLKDLLKDLSKSTLAKLYSMSIETAKLHSHISYINTIKAHFPKLRTIIRNMYQISKDCRLIKSIDDALNEKNVNKIKVFGKKEVIGSVIIQTKETSEIIEDDIIAKYNQAFKLLSKKSLDTPKQECISCNKLCCLRDVCALGRLRKKIISDIWTELQEYYARKNITSSTFICHACLCKIRANQLPAACILNDLYVNETPAEISILNDYENLLIQRAKSFQVVVSMEPVSNKHIPNKQMVKKVKGRTFHLPLPLEETLKKLPHSENAINPNHELYIIVRSMPTKAKIVWEDLVDVNKIFAALTLLKRVNPHYAEIKLPDEPQRLLDALDKNLEHTINEPDFPENENLLNERIEENALLTQITSEKETDYEQYTIYPLHQRRLNTTVSELYQMLKVNSAPIDARDKNIDVKCFPQLYLEGKFGQYHNRKQKLTSSEFIKARLLSKHAQFRLNQQYLFYLLNDSNLRQLSSGIFYKMNIFNQKETITAGKYLEMLSKDELEGDLTAIFGRLRNTEQFWRKPRNDVNCMTLNYGPATWFLTLSPSEWSWDDLGDYIKTVNGSAMANKCVSELVALDPVSASRFIDNKFHAMLDFLTSPDEPLGKVEHYFWRREYQSRGAQHFHMMLWIKDAPILHESPLDEVAHFISKYVTCAVPEKSLSPTLHKRVQSYQNHKHNHYCMRKKKTKGAIISTCRFGFPRVITDNIIIRDVVESIAARKSLSSNNRLYNVQRKKNEEMINDYNPAVLLAWNGNMDIQFVGEKTTILNYYITKYSTKGEKTHATGGTFNDINSCKNLRSRLYNIGLRVLGNRECGSLEASDTLLGIPLYGTDPKTTIRWLDVNMHRNRRVKSKADMSILDSNSTDIFYESWIDSHYPMRPNELEEMHLYDFMRYFDIVKSRPISEKAKYYVIEESKKYLKKRDRPYLINHYQYDAERMPEKFFFSLLLMFKPWRVADDLKMGFDTYTQAYNSVKVTMKDALTYANLRREQREKIEKAFEMVEDKLEQLKEEQENLQLDEGPENPLEFEALEAQNAMDDFNDIDLAPDEDSGRCLDEMISNLNSDQRRVFDRVSTILTYPCNNSEILRCFVSGTGGTGKSFLIKTLKCYVQKKLQKKVAISAPTGIAAFNVGGLTIHRLLQLPVEHKQTPKYKSLSDEVLKVLRMDLKEVVLLIIDEISMVSNVTLTYIHLRLSEIFDTSDVEDGWFGKIHMLVFGDLLQLPPVRESLPFEKLTLSEVNKLFGSLSVPNLWSELFSYDELLLNMRQVNDSTFSEMLKRIRLGVITQTDHEILHKRLIPLLSNTNKGRLHEITQYLSRLPQDTVCLLPTKNMCQQLNEAMLNTISSPEIKLIAKDSFDCPRFLTKRAHNALQKFEEDDSMTAGLENTIVIKEGATVMLKRNIDVSLGLVNGSIGTVKKVRWDPDKGKNVKTVVIQFKNCLHELSPVKTKFEVINRAYVHREQFPISVAYAITIHKSQGLSLNNALIDIGSSVFSCGQAYVALSRVTCLDGVHLINLDVSNMKANESAIEEYNRLRSLYRPELSSIEHTKKRRKLIKDRQWALQKHVANVQHVKPERKKRESKKIKRRTGNKCIKKQSTRGVNKQNSQIKWKSRDRKYGISVKQFNCMPMVLEADGT